MLIGMMKMTTIIKDNRPSWDEYFLEIAKVVSTRSTCFRTKCGAVIVKDKKILSTGYNGSPRYQKNCAEIGFCYRNKNNIKSGTELEKCRACGCHAESNAIALASRDGSATNDSIMYMYGNKDICTMCKGIIANAGIIKVIMKTTDGYCGLQSEIKTYIPEKDWTIHQIDK